jgi:A/G-specific adenine glycosylase
MARQCHSPAPARKRRVDANTVRAFHYGLVRWYRRHHRKLPWRSTRDPYRIWVSEIMLQQTRVNVVRDYYLRWIRAFPTIVSLANAPARRVLKLWEGLGYYTRARNLHRAAKMIVRKARSSVPLSRDWPARACPTTAAEWITLPGIGRYTAGAIASIAFGQRVPVVDGNVARVLARVFGLRGNVTKPATRKTLWKLAAQILPARNPGTFNQALMELGALVCVPVTPRCAGCPLNRICVARGRGEQHELPNRGPRREQRLVTHNAAFVRRGERILLRRRPARGLLAGLWELPALLKRPQPGRRPLLTLRHTITNKRITLRVFAREPSGEGGANGDFRWASRNDLARLALPAAHRRALERILAAQQHE